MDASITVGGRKSVPSRFSSIRRRTTVASADFAPMGRSSSARCGFGQDRHMCRHSSRLVPAASPWPDPEASLPDARACSVRNRRTARLRSDRGSTQPSGGPNRPLSGALPSLIAMFADDPVARPSSEAIATRFGSKVNSHRLRLGDLRFRRGLLLDNGLWLFDGGFSLGLFDGFVRRGWRFGSFRGRGRKRLFLRWLRRWLLLHFLLCACLGVRRLHLRQAGMACQPCRRFCQLAARCNPAAT